MEINFVAKPANTVQIINTPNQMVVISDTDSLGLTKACSWDNDKKLIVETVINRSDTHVHIEHILREEEEYGEFYINNSVSININIQDNRLVITEDWDSWEDDQTIIVNCSGDQQVEIVEFLVSQLTNK